MDEPRPFDPKTALTFEDKIIVCYLRFVRAHTIQDIATAMGGVNNARIADVCMIADEIFRMESKNARQILKDARQVREDNGNGSGKNEGSAALQFPAPKGL